MSKDLGWQTPAIDPASVISWYVKNVSGVPGVKVWVRIDGSRVHFITAIPDDRDAERSLYEAELSVMDEFGSEIVSFDVYRTAMPPTEASSEASLVLSA